MPENKDQKATPSQQIPVRQPPAKQVPVQQPPAKQVPVQQRPARPNPSASEAYSSEGTASDPNARLSSEQNLAGGLNGSYRLGNLGNLPGNPPGNPSFVQSSNLHTTGAAPAHYPQQQQQQQAGPVPFFPQAPQPTFPPVVLCDPGSFQQPHPAFARPQPGVSYYNTARPNPYFVSTGYATAPMAIPMAMQSQPAMNYGVQPMQGAQPCFTGSGYPMAVPVQGQPVQGQPVPGYQPQFVTAATAPEYLPHGMLPPDIMGIGRTHGENTVELLDAMHTGNLLEPQDIKPADDDPGRMYLLRELDGNWTRRSRFTIDRLACRWYITPWGGFYAVRLED